MFPAVFAIFIHFSGDRACIKDYVFIDPPYNTGNDFIYADDFMRSQEEENAQMGIAHTYTFSITLMIIIWIRGIVIQKR